MEKLRARTGEEKDLRKKKLLAAAKHLFSTHGYQGTRINMITKEAGLSPAAFYLYFKGKTDIYRELCLEGTQVLSGMIREALTRNSDDHASRITALGRAYVDFFIRHRAYYDIITVHHLGQNDFFSDLDMVPELEARGTELLTLLSQVIESGIKAKEFSVTDPWKTAALLWAMMDGVLLMEVRQTTGYIDLNLETLIQHFFETVMAILKKHQNKKIYHINSVQAISK